MGQRNYTVVEVCSCGNEARMTTISGARRCGVCVTDNGVVSVSDDRISELLVVLKDAISGDAVSVAWLRSKLVPIIGKVEPR